MTSPFSSALVPARKLHIKTWGCQMNAYDSGRMADLVAPLGYAPTEEARGADLVILNTCHIREKATDKLFSELGRLRLFQKERESAGQRMVIAVAGCVAQAEGAEIQRRAPFVDMVFGPQAYHRLPEMIARTLRGAGAVLETDFPPEAKFDHLPVPEAGGGVSVFLAAQEGCDKFCTFCVVPYTRGAEYSRPPEALLEEARQRVAAGAREITLLGQTINAWQSADSDGQVWSFGRLLRHMAEIPGLLRLRYTTSHPRDLGPELLEAHRDLRALMPFLHLPVQSGSDSVLAAMNRGYVAEDYRRLVDRLRAARLDMALSTDIIVGFPGETDADFRATLALVEAIGFAQAYSFAYSPRPGTPAAALPNPVPDTVKQERLQELQALLRTQQEAFNRACVGTTLPVLVENVLEEGGGVFGRTPWMQGTRLAVAGADPASLVGREISVPITTAALNSLGGVVAGREK